MEFPKEFTIHKGQTVEFAEGLKLTFEGHSHKRTFINGPPSPLMVYVGYEINLKKPIFQDLAPYPL
ncbi:MAG: hypothetical protein EHM45_20040 [Desulfobacteraceae bacterium]|nr:MAG: hypothetical protein EHM45_20040 [Desulfobacteraceae bacterium]